MVELRLALRVLRAQRGREVFAHLVTITGFLLITLVVLVSLATPLAQQEQRRTELARYPVLGSQGVGHVERSREYVGTQVWTRWRVSGVTPSTPLPPGLGAWPASGRAALSPALRDAVRADPGRFPQLRQSGGEVLAPEALTGPDEWVSYEMDTPRSETTPVDGSAAAARVPTEGVVGYGVGPTQLADDARLPTSWLFAQILLLVVVPAGIFCVLCARWGLARQEERARKLFLLGMSPRRVARVFAVEMSLPGSAGTLAGVLLFAVLEPWLARSGWLGTVWWPGAGLPPWWQLLLGWMALVTTLVLGYRGAALRSMTRVRVAARPARARVWIAMAVGPASVIALAVLLGNGLRGRRLSIDQGYGGLVLVLAVLGLCMASAALAPVVVRAVTRGLLRSRVRGLPRVGVARAGAWSVPLGWMLSALAVLTMTTTGSLGFLGFIRSDIMGNPHRPVLIGDLSPATSKDRARALDLLGPDATFTLAVGDQTPPRIALVGTCAQVEAELGPLAGCREDQAQSSRDGGITQVPVPGHRTIPVAPTLEGPNSSLVRIPRDQARDLIIARGSDFRVQLEAGVYERLMRDLSSTAPSVRYTPSGFDNDMLGAYQDERSILRGLLTGTVVITLAGLILALADVAERSRRSDASLLGLGVTRRARRRVDVAAAVVAVGAMALPMTLAGWLVGAGLRLPGTFSRREVLAPGLLAVAATVTLASVVAAAVAALFRAGGGVGTDDLRPPD